MVSVKHVGRVGALAVALGIGSAVAAVPAVAWAQPDGGASADASDKPTDSSRGTTKTPDKPSRSAKSDDTEGAASRTSTSETDGVAASHTSGRGKRAAAEEREAKRAAAEDISDEVDAAESATSVTGEAEFEPQTLTESTVVKPLSTPRAATQDPGKPEAPGASSVLLTVLASARRSFDERTAEANAAATESSISQSAAEAASPPIPGSAYQSPVIAPDGTRYQVTNGGSTTRVNILDGDGQVIATSEEIQGVGTAYADAVLRPDGTLIVVTSTNRRTNSIVSAVDSEGNVTRLATLIGATDTPVTVGADGALYFKTEIVPFSPFADPIEYRFVRISENNFVRSYSYDTQLELESDGTAHLVSSRFGFSTLRTINPSGWTRSTLLPFGSDPSAPILGQDGSVYVTAGVRGLFGSKTTRVYTVDGDSRTVRSIVGLPGETVVTSDGIHLETFTFDGSTDDGTGTTYLSAITASSIATSDAIEGRIAGFQVSADGTIYAPVSDPSADETAVAVVNSDGSVDTVVLPGRLVVRDRSIRGGGTQSVEDLGYVNYTVDDVEYVAVLGPNGTVVRTVELPEGATGGTVFFGPDGAAYELLEYLTPGNYISRQILALSTDTYTPNVPGAPFGADDVVFGPNGVGYLLVGTSGDYAIDVVGFNAAGDTMIPPSGFDRPHVQYTSRGEREVLAFGLDGTAYLTNWGPTDAGVYALTSTGAQKVADLEYSQLGIANLPTFGPDGTGYVATTGTQSEGGFATTVTTLSPPA